MAVNLRRSPRIPSAHLDAWSRRLPSVVGALAGGRPTRRELAGPTDLAAALRGVADLHDHGHVWLLLAVLTGRLPDETTVLETVRACELEDTAALWETLARETTAASSTWHVRVAVEEVLVDVAHTVSTPLTTGIQRVARETVGRWLRDQECTPVAWTRDFEAIRELTPLEHDRITLKRAAVDTADDAETTVVVPWRASYAVPELAAEPGRSTRLLALARFSPNRTGVIGFDCVPLTSAETTATGFSAVFAGNLAAVRHFDVVAAISDAARTEYQGWRSMLEAIGQSGPDVVSVPLAVEAAASSPQDVEAARRDMLVGSLPLVLVVGSHEPRKNHLAILHAAETLWRDGVEFSLSFIGGNSWGSEAFTGALAGLQRAGRPVDARSRATDAQLWSAYRVARCTVFPSFNEGFGLPVAESLAVGTPAITSGFGSMLEIARDGGALTVDPRDDHAIARAMRALVTDDVLHARLSAAARARAPRSWDDYAAETWDLLVG
ncbi:glycosyltransferase [Actinotalea sp. C106]|uniref:glycosyltransferase n=1 Tax=Actinotalea sp. C106 TaxID=2908644 RepID=UPI002028FC02|nr:glycosyltransferase [Actinotalea sp. C106]